ncbi:hypothetical protein DIPPA_21988 [Diplonema papillatum]|nr:hypothetical protein DIPPA_21988 [Diplonema papillatum]
MPSQKFSSLFLNSDSSSSDDDDGAAAAEAAKPTGGGDAPAAANVGGDREAEVDAGATEAQEAREPPKQRVRQESSMPADVCMAVLQRYSTPYVCRAITGQGDGGMSVLTNKEPTALMTSDGGARMAGRAITVTVRSGEPDRPSWRDFIAYLQSIPGPKVIMAHDVAGGADAMASLIDPPTARVFQNLGVVGCITDGGASFCSELGSIGFPCIARCKTVLGGPQACSPLRWNTDLSLYGAGVRTGSLVHADGHGFVLVPPAVHLAPIVDTVLRLTSSQLPSTFDDLERDLGWTGSKDSERTAAA